MATSGKKSRLRLLIFSLVLVSLPVFKVAGRPEAELLMARAYFHLGKEVKAGKLYRKIMKDYPDSSFSREARKDYLRQF